MWDRVASLLSAESLSVLRTLVENAQRNATFMRGWGSAELVREVKRIVLSNPSSITRHYAGRAFHLLGETEYLLPSGSEARIARLVDELVAIGVAEARATAPITYDVRQPLMPSVLRRFRDYASRWSGGSPGLQQTADAGTSQLRRQGMVTSTGYRIEYPFPDPPVEWKDFFEPTAYRLKVLQRIDNEGRYIPETLKSPLGASNVFPACSGRVIKFYANAGMAERLIAIQPLLDMSGLAHMRAASDPLALLIARQGVIVQDRFPSGARMLFDFARDHTDSETYQLVEKHLGSGARGQLEAFLQKIEVLRADDVLKKEAFKRGYCVFPVRGLRSACDLNIRDAMVLDVHGGDVCTNVFWHESSGWFFCDW